MKKNIVLFIICMTACIYISCDDSNAVLHDSIINDMEAPAYLQVQTNIAPTISVTRSFLKTTMPNNAEMGLFARGLNDQLYCDVAGNNNVKSVYNGTSWTNTPQVILNREPATIYAYYPYQEGETDPEAVHINHTKRVDFLYGSNVLQSPKTSSSNPVASINMKHAFAKLVFKLSKKNYAGKAQLDLISIWNVNGNNTLISEGSINLKNGVITKDPTKKGWAQATHHPDSRPLQIIPDTPSSNEADYPVIYVMPTLIRTGKEVEMSFSIDGQGYPFPVPANTNWESGKKYVYNVVLSGTSIAAQNVTVADWNSGTNGNIDIN